MKTKILSLLAAGVSFAGCISCCDYGVDPKDPAVGNWGLKLGYENMNAGHMIVSRDADGSAQALVLWRWASPIPMKNVVLDGNKIAFDHPWGFKFEGEVTGNDLVATAMKGDKVVASVTCRPSKKLHTEVRVSHTALKEGEGYDAAAVRVRILDENNNLASYAQLPVRYEVSGDLMLIGPDVSTAEGGMTGTYVRTVGHGGAGTLTIRTEQTVPVTISFTIEEE